MTQTNEFNQTIVDGLTKLGVTTKRNEFGMVLVDRTSMCIAFGDGKSEDAAYAEAKAQILLMLPELSRVMWGHKTDDDFPVEVYIP
jgi:hypothetical protein